MPTLLRLFIVLICAGAFVMPAAASERVPKRYTIEQFMATTSITGASFSADESRLLFSSNASGIWNAYTLPAGGGTPQALTASTTDSVFAVSYFPEDDRVLFTRDQGGNEQNHLFVRERDGSERDLTPGAKLKAQFYGFTPDGSAFHVATNERDPKFFDLYRYDARTYERRLVYRNDKGLNVAAISRDGRWLALGKTNTTTDADVYLLDLQAPVPYPGT